VAAPNAAGARVCCLVSPGVLPHKDTLLCYRDYPQLRRPLRPFLTRQLQRPGGIMGKGMGAHASSADESGSDDSDEDQDIQIQIKQKKKKKKPKKEKKNRNLKRKRL